MSEQMRAVFSIVDYGKSEDIIKIYNQQSIPVSLVTHGHGAADSEMLNYLRFGENKKCIIISLMTAERAGRFILSAEEQLQLSEPGRGIIFSVPISSMTAFLAELIRRDGEKYTENSKESEQKMSADYQHELIVAIITKGFFPEVKAAANSAGAKGGTLIHSLGLGGKEAQKFLGISIQPEKDVILIIVRRQEKNKVMKAIADAAGISTQGRGIIFSVPVDSAFGLSEAPMLSE